VTLTVAQQALFVTLGTSHLIEALSSTQYAKPYSVLVTDANSNPIQGARVELNMYPTRYEKGFYTLFFDEGGQCVGWGKVRTVADADRACENEDVNRNGLLNPGEDINSNDALDPGNVAQVPRQVVTDAAGFGLFNVLYAREFTWVEIELEARTTVAGSEASSKARFFLPGLASDFNDCEVSPPGQLSPYGLATTCGCDEQVDPACPTVSGGAGPVLVIPTGPDPVPRTGGTVRLSISGGTQLSYSVQFIPGSGTATGIGTLTNDVTGQTSTTIVLANAGETVLLTLDALPTSIILTTHTIRVVDRFTSQLTELDIQQGN
jgi:hypothetical protein